MSSHEFIQFPPQLRTISPRIGLLLGEIQAKIEHIKRLPILPDESNRLRTLYFAKGLHSTTAIEGNTFSEAEVARIIRQDLQAPPSRAYQERQITNMMAACNSVGQHLRRGADLDFSPALLHRYHRQVLADLQDSVTDEEVRLCAFRQHKVTVGRYLAPPPNPVARFMAQYCDWLNAKPVSAAGYELAAHILKAIFAHVYFAWIHPYGDGNGRLARLIEFGLLLRAGAPDITAHLLSNFYNKTRDKYYQQLQYSHGEYDSEARAYPAQADLSHFLEYALQGFRDELDEQLAVIYERQTRAIWHDYIHSVFCQRFSDRLSETQGRRKRLALALSDYRLNQPVRKEAIPDVSPALARAYANKSARTLQRDLNALVAMGLLQRLDKGYQPNIDILLGFFARASNESD